MMYEPGSIAQDAPGLEDYIGAVKRRFITVLVCAAVGLVLANIYTQIRTDNYKAAARVELSPSPVGSVNAQLVNPILEKEREILRSLPIARVVVERVGADRVEGGDPQSLLRPMEVDFRPDSDVLNLSFSSTDPELAKDAVNGFADVYVEQRNAEADAFYDDRIAATNALIVPLQAQIDQQEQDILTAQAAAARADAGSAERQSQFDIASQINQTRAQDMVRLRALQTDLAEFQRSKETLNDPSSVLEYAETPRAPLGLGATTLMAVGLILGSILGVVLAFTLDRLDKTARDRDSIETTLGVDVLASVPNLGFARSLGGALLVMRSEKRSSVILVAQESYRRLRSSLLFLAGAQGLRSVLLTSATPGEGKSVTSANTAIALAESGKRVVLVSADLRRPSLDKLFGLDESEGLGDWLSDPEMKRIPMRPVGENLRIVPAGNLPRNPGELMSSPRFDSLIKTLSSMADIVLVDSPPVLNAADAVGASVYVDGVIVVVDSLRTDTASLNRLRSDIERAGGKLLGAVLNKERRAAITSYGQRYTYETKK